LHYGIGSTFIFLVLAGLNDESEEFDSCQYSYHDQLYDNSRGENTGWINQKSLIDFAKGAGVGNITQFSQCADSQKYSSLIEKNYDLAQSLALTATPSFILLAERKAPLVIVGSQPYHIFDYLIRNKMS
jgi:protein-disulfide isomerase